MNEEKLKSLTWNCAKKLYLDIKVALVCIARDEDYYLDEWLEYNRKLGFDQIFMYENNWRCSYLEKDYLTKIPFDGNDMQVSAYNHFVRSNRYFDWVAFLDCDEFITLLKHNNIKELIREHINQNGIALNWVLFGSGGRYKRKYNSLLKQFKYRNAHFDQHVKIIMNQKAMFRMESPHNSNIPIVNTNGKLFSGPFNANGATDVAYVNHYRNKTYEDWEIRVKRGRADTINPKFFPKLKEWEAEKTNDLDVCDINALKFMYGGKKK